MENTLMSRFFEVKNLEETIKQLKQNIENEEQHLKELQENCNHVIIISKLVARGQVKARCLFCQQYHVITDTFDDVPSENVITAYSSKKYFPTITKHYSINDIYHDIEEQSKKILEQNPNITEKEVCEQLKKWLNVEDY